MFADQFGSVMPTDIVAGGAAFGDFRRPLLQFADVLTVHVMSADQVSLACGIAVNSPGSNVDVQKLNRMTGLPASYIRAILA